MFEYREMTFDGPTQKMEYDTEVAQALVKKNELLKKAAAAVDETSVVVLSDDASIAKGKGSFVTKCAACHGQNGEGLVGPNLTDEYWIHGGGIKDIFKTIKYGYPEKSMQSWKELLSPVQIAEVASFIKSLRGSNPPGAKEKQGDLYTEDNTASATIDPIAGVPVNIFKLVNGADTYYGILKIASVVPGTSVTYEYKIGNTYAQLAILK